MATRNPITSRSQSPSYTSPRLPAPAAPFGDQEEHIDDVDHYAQQDVLTLHWLRRPRLSRPPPLPSAPPQHFVQPTSSAIQSNQNNYSNIIQDVLHPLNDVSGPSRTAPTTTPNASFLQAPLESRLLPSFPASPFNNGSINSHITRPRTSYPIFQSTTELAAHHGIPRKLPPIPRTNSLRPSVSRFVQQVPLPDTANPPSPQQYFENLVSSYLDMVSKKPDDTITPDQSPAVPQTSMELSIEDATAAGHIVNAMLATPPEWQDYLTSPFDESPFDTFLETPLQGSADMGEFLTSPAVEDFWDPDSLYSDLPLLSNPTPNESALELSKMSVSMPPPASLTSLNFDNLLTMSPYTPSLDHLSVFPSPRLPTERPNPAPVSSRSTKSRPTGTRKNVTPESLVPIDAPTQTRSYVTPSVTSRKELPAVFAKKRARSMAFDDEDDELDDETADSSTLPPTPSEAEAIAAKRRQNTLAARRSRKRKLEYQRELEDVMEKERREKEMWKGRALRCQTLLRTFGVIEQFGDEA